MNNKNLGKNNFIAGLETDHFDKKNHIPVNNLSGSTHKTGNLSTNGDCSAAYSGKKMNEIRGIHPS